MIELWGRSNAYNVQKPLWLLAELGLDFKHHDIGRNSGDLESADFLALNPRARVPVLRLGDAVVWESNSILRYLANQFEATEFYPTDPLPRSQVERWMDWQATELNGAWRYAFMGLVRRDPAFADPAGIAAVIVAAVFLLGTNVNNTFNKVASSIK